MVGYPATGCGYLALTDSEGATQDLSPWVERVGPLGRAVSGHDAAGLNDAASRTMAGPEAAQEFAVAGRWDGTPGIGPDAVLCSLVGRTTTVDYGPVGRSAGQRRITGRFVCLSYRVVSQAGQPVRFEAAFRQDGPVSMEVW